jgi:uncharacterized protein
MKTSLAARVAEIDWEAALESLSEQSFAALPRILSDEECAELVACYRRPELFRSRIDMAKFRFGRGEYQYFDYPLPVVVEELRRSLYPPLARIANAWAGTLNDQARFPDSLSGLLDLCHGSGQTRPTPLMLHYTAGDFNCLHQDVYGEIAFPLQAVFFLSQPGKDYSGGEFLLLEQAPRAQTKGRALLRQQGEALVITTRHRPAQGKRGAYRLSVRHGVSAVTAGERWTLGIIFHDAK